ncbi:hemin uptake protein HemP [Sulfurospirillum barnesii]|uniref:Hemin uptake protein hemP n=1 Tax=Sulfurospirillum barnesii (strain ATCC 700032 / DSM 10660 / SES-3) TaxID=760154 RepID=I3XY93_SULBS|nr:hemin uptake protein HemP [Sulfurospirillum barnesii]AFL68917.1 Hemin uptake protein hemP [Sulfurospirillum barnesii SES-3]
MSKQKVVDSKYLFGEDKIIKIVHNGVEYVLRITKDDKLILTK